MDAEDRKIEFKFDLKKIIALIIVIVLITIFLIFIFKDSKYKKIEESMIATAKNYVKTNNYNVTEQLFLSVSQIGVADLNGCSKASGVTVSLKNNSLVYEPYLVCDNYTSKTISTDKGKYIKLLGANPYVIDSNTAFTDPGYNANGYTVEKISNYKPSPGVYQIVYYVYDGGKRKETVTRTIIVSNVASEDAPVLTLNGESNIVLKVGTQYIEPGYTAIDATDGNITNRVTVSRNVNSNQIGDYEIVYSVTNSKGLKASKKRIVSVVDKNLNIYTTASYSPEIDTNDKVIITIKNTGNTYAYTINPDGSKNNNLEFEYVVTENKLYIFRIYDKSNNYTEKRVLIDNIDKVAPTGSCTAISQGGVVTYNVVAEDDSELKGYSYYMGSSYSEYTSSSTAKYTMNYLNSNVMIQDVAGNITKIDCETKKISTITSLTVQDSATVYVGNTYQIPVTITPANADKNEIKWEILSGDSYISLSNSGLVNAKAEGTAVVRLTVQDSDIIRSTTINVKKKSTSSGGSGGSSGGSGGTYPGNDGTVSEKCGKNARTLTGYVNGSRINDYGEINLAVGESVTISLYLPTECGSIKLLTRTSGDGESIWRDYFTMSSNPSVNRYDSSTFVATDHFDWTITGKKKTGRKIMLTQTTFQETSNFAEIKSFFHVYVKVQ